LRSNTPVACRGLPMRIAPIIILLPLLVVFAVLPLVFADDATEERPAKGRMILGTRGFARVVADTRNVNKEAQTHFPIEFPYGAADGWKLTYQGFSDGTKDDVHILAAGVWIQHAADKPLSRQRVSFRGANGVVIAPSALQESDDISTALLPGAR